jgi:AcrR family transcriptional regulator
MSPKTRAKPMSPERRRAAILDAVVPLLVARGAAITTAEMAQAAGIAEGTIFRVFPDKPALLDAAMVMTMDPAPIREALESIDPELPMDAQLTEAARVLADRFGRVGALIDVMRSIPHAEKPNHDSHGYVSRSMAEIISSLARLMERHQDRLAIEPTQAAFALRGLVFTNSHSLLTPGDRMTPEQLVDILMNGIVDKEVG